MGPILRYLLAVFLCPVMVQRIQVQVAILLDQNAAILAYLKEKERLCEKSQDTE